jgi:hypothetical protein
MNWNGFGRKSSWPSKRTIKNLAEISEEEHENPQPMSLVSEDKCEYAMAQNKVEWVTAILCCSARAFLVLWYQN